MCAPLALTFQTIVEEMLLFLLSSTKETIHRNLTWSSEAAAFIC